MHTFSRRRLSVPFLDGFKPHLHRALIFVGKSLIHFVVWSIIFLKIFNHAEAAPLAFGNILLGKEYRVSFVPSGYWQAPKEPSYKNERLHVYQDLLKNRGITNRDHLKLFVAQLLQENGAVSENVDGDNGCSIGIPQRNVCLYGYTAKSFRKKYPNWKTWETQMKWMADYTVQNYKKYDGNPKCTIIHHNRPASARNGCRDTAARYYGKIVAKSATLSLL